MVARSTFSFALALLLPVLAHSEAVVTRSAFGFALTTLLLPVLAHSASEAVCDTDNMSTLVVGATGATGKHVVKILLDRNEPVRVVVRYKERMEDLLKEMKVKEESMKLLSITEASLLDLSDDELQEQVKGTKAVVSTLGHNLNLQGVFGHPRRLVTDAVKRLTSAIIQEGNKESTKFILMGSDGVANPNGEDDPRSFGERSLLFVLRYWCLRTPTMRTPLLILMRSDQTRKD